MVVTRKQSDSGERLVGVHVRQVEPENGRVQVNVPERTLGLKSSGGYSDHLYLFMSGYQMFDMPLSEGGGSAEAVMLRWSDEVLGALEASDLAQVAGPVEELLDRRDLSRDENRLLMTLTAYWLSWSKLHPDQAGTPAYRAQRQLAEKIARRLMAEGMP
jgi:hypothetical protein